MFSLLSLRPKFSLVVANLRTDGPSDRDTRRRKTSVRRLCQERPTFDLFSNAVWIWNQKTEKKSPTQFFMKVKKKSLRIETIQFDHLSKRSFNANQVTMTSNSSIVLRFRSFTLPPIIVLSIRLSQQAHFFCESGYLDNKLLYRPPSPAPVLIHHSYTVPPITHILSGAQKKTLQIHASITIFYALKPNLHQKP